MRIYVGFEEISASLSWSLRKAVRLRSCRSLLKNFPRIIITFYACQGTEYLSAIIRCVSISFVLKQNRPIGLHFSY